MEREEASLTTTSDRASGALGLPLRRREDARLLTGAGCFTDDLAPKGCLQLLFLRSPYPRGRIVRLEVAGAATLPGVRAVLTADHVRGLGRLPVNPVGGPVHPPPFPLLADRRVQALGQPVAAVVAETLAIAQEALELIDFEVAPEAPLLTAGEARSSSPLYKEVPGNLAIERERVEGDPESAFAAAACVVEAQISHPRVAPTSLEPRATLASWDRRLQRLTLWSGSQTPHRLRSDMAAILGLPPEQVRAIVPDVGGAFGLKASLYPEDVVVAQASRLLGHPVSWSATRSEDFLSATHGRGAQSRGALALDAEGRMLGLRADFLFPLGHWMPFSGAVPVWNAGRILPGPYAIEHLQIASRGFLTNTAPMGIYRGAGRPEAAMLMERLVEEAARRLQMDPLEIRHRNFRARDSGNSGTGADSRDYAPVLARLSDVSRYPSLHAEVDRRRGRGERVGIGLCCYLEPSGQGWESARVQLQADGRLSAATGSSAQGQGRETAYAQIVAEVFQVSPERVEVLHGDTQKTPAGIGALASRSTPIGGSALLLAARESLKRVKRQAAALLGCSAEALESSDEGLRDTHGSLLSWEELARASNDGCSAELVYEAAGEAWGFGCCLSVASIDVETGVPTVEQIYYVDDAGRLVNPLLADGQIHGGVAQGLGEALLERLVYGEDGQLLTGSLMDYALPRASDMPALHLGHHETPSPCNPLGARGLGETGTIGAPPAILNALLDALGSVRLEELEMPLTSEKLWRALQGKKK